MAHHIPCGTPEDNELHAIEVLKNSFGPEWVLFTNIPKYISVNEIDACLLGPRGMTVVELKWHRGPIYCPLVGDWKGVPEGNPLEQASRAAQLLKQKLTEKDPALQRVYVDYLVLMTREFCELGVHADLKRECRVSLLVDAVDLVGGRLISARPITLDSRRRIVRAISGEPVPPAIDAVWQALEPAQPRPASPQDRAPDPAQPRQTPLELRPPERAEFRPVPLEEPWGPKVGYSLGIIACVCVLVFSLFKLFHCDQACTLSKSREAERQRVAALPPPPPPLPPHSNVSQTCDGKVYEKLVWPGQFHKFPSGGPRSDWMGDQHSNPCAVYFEVLQGVMGFGTDYGVGVNGWEEHPGRTQWPVRVDLVAGGAGKVARWKYIVCREWHPVMKEWRCR